MGIRDLRQKVYLPDPKKVTIEKWFEIFRGIEATDWMLPLFWSMAAYPPKCIVGEIGMRGGSSTAAFLMGVRHKGGHVDSKTLDFPEPLDVLYIDGDHSYGGARADLDRHLKSVKPGGVVMLHDPCSCPDDVGALCEERGIPVIPIGAGLGIFIKLKE